MPPGRSLVRLARIGQRERTVERDAHRRRQRRFTSALGLPLLDGLGADGDGAHTVTARTR